MIIDLDTFVVRSETGNIDVDMTLDKFHTIVVTYRDEIGSRFTRIGAALQTVFDQQLGKAIVMPSLEYLVLHELNASEGELRDLKVLVKSYIQANCGKKEEGYSFETRKGPGGGVFRWVDHLPTKIKELEAKLAAKQVEVDNR